jgi:hypothetical protein
MERYRPLFEALNVMIPLHEIWMNGYKYVSIYKVEDLPQSVFEALGK